MAESCDFEGCGSPVASETTAYTDHEAEVHAEQTGVEPRIFSGEMDQNGGLLRQGNYFIVPFGDRENEWTADAGRYCIYWTEGCNWSNRPLIARELLGLTDVVSDQLVHTTGETNVYGWGFPDEPDHRDPRTGAYFLSEFYKNADPDFHGRASTPTLVDLKRKAAVNNDYHRLSNYLEVQFRKFQPKDAPDLYPKKFRHEIDQFNDWLFPHINNGYYRMALCTKPDPYERAFNDFYDSMDKLDERLENNRFLFGDFITDSDIRFYVTLVRWDLVYFQNIGPVKHRIVDYPNIWPYVRELYQIPAFHKFGFLKLEANGYRKEGEKAPRKAGDFSMSYLERVASKMDLEKLWSLSATEKASRQALSSHPDLVFRPHPEGETPEDYQSEISYCRWNSPDPADRDPENPANSPLDADASINPVKSLIDRI